MCNINAFFPGTRSITNKTLSSFWDFALDSNTTNKDGFGLWIANNTYRWLSSKVPSLLSIYKTLLRQPYIITHQRISTSGKNAEMIHPYVFDIYRKGSPISQLIGIHNGIFLLKEPFDTKLYSDSYMFFRELTTQIEKYEGALDLTNSISIDIALQNILKSMFAKIGGSYSVLLSINNVFYYFRRSRTLYAYRYKGGLLLSSTKREIANEHIQPVEDVLYNVDLVEAVLKPIGSLRTIKNTPTLPSIATIRQASQKSLKALYQEEPVPIHVRDMMNKVASLLCNHAWLFDQDNPLDTDLFGLWYVEVIDELLGNPRVTTKPFCDIGDIDDLYDVEEPFNMARWQ